MTVFLAFQWLVKGNEVTQDTNGDVNKQTKSLNFMRL